jgi:hypothetical protein
MCPHLTETPRADKSLVSNQGLGEFGFQRKGIGIYRRDSHANNRSAVLGASPSKPERSRARARVQASVIDLSNDLAAAMRERQQIK